MRASKTQSSNIKKTTTAANTVARMFVSFETLPLIYARAAGRRRQGLAGAVAGGRVTFRGAYH